MRLSKTAWLIASIILALGVWLGYRQLTAIAPVTALSVSSDGRYAITTHRDKQLVLWRLGDRKTEHLATNANIYSAFFVPGQDAFLWQDLDDRVHIQNVDGTVIKECRHIPTYGHVIDADLTHYLSADVHWNIYEGCGDDREPVKQDGDHPSFLGSGKVINLAMDDAGRYLVTAGSGRGSRDSDLKELPPSVTDDQRFSNYSQVTLWSLDTLEPLAKLPGNVSKTHATISPDGKWVVSGDENGNVLVWPTADPTDEQVILGASFHHGVLDWRSDLPRGHPDRWDKSKLIPAPDDATETNVAVKFIHDSQYYLRFGYRSHTAALFEVDNPWPIKYFDLGDDPFPATADYSRNLAIDTAPKANILVMGQRDGGGILVYRFDPDELTLERVWVGR